ncbi:hypothetical protein [Scytonema sp. PCC 10023]|uniref:hypothetical protein n=1 Tax=Scytonema sp. PCC 10023 TaxID=1680591 RepID=UPI0039C6B73D
MGVKRKDGDGCADDSTVRRCGSRRCAYASNVEHGLTEKAAMVVLIIPLSGDAEAAAARTHRMSVDRKMNAIA